MEPPTWLDAEAHVPARAFEPGHLGRVCVLAPHPDDESLGCGGLLALLAHRDCQVLVVCVSDGSGSHPGSRSHPRPVLSVLRKGELAAALEILGLRDAGLVCLDLPDGDVPHPDAPGFEATRGRLQSIVDRFGPDSLLAPWRRDPHADHRATWHLAHHLRRAGSARRLLEYPVWLGEQGNPGDRPRADEVDLLVLDVEGLVDRKRAAIAAHRSQTTDLIADDPNGFRLCPKMIDRLCGRYEYYFEGDI